MDNQKKQKENSNMLTKTFSLMIKRNNLAIKNDENKTSFLELFFDLGIVFVFALLAKEIPGALGLHHLDIGILQGARIHEKETAVSIIFWIINFSILWLTWKKFNKWFSHNGGETAIAHIFTFILLVSISLQAVTLTIDNGFFAKYGLLLSLIITQGTFFLFYSITYKVGKDIISVDAKENRKKSFWTFFITMFGTVLYVTLMELGMLGTTISGTKELWKEDLFLIIIVTGIIISEVVGTLNSIKNNKTKNREMTVSQRNKERHHLLIIITFGEAILFNLTSLSGNKGHYGELFGEMILNILIIMLMWYTYKTFIHKIDYKVIKRNKYLYSFMHILIIAFILFTTSMLTSYANAMHDLYNNPSLLAAVKPFEIIDLKIAIHSTYPTLYVSGVLGFFAIIAIFSLVVVPKKTLYSSIITKEKVHFFLLSLLMFPITIALLVLVQLGFELDLVYILLAVGLSILTFTAGYSYLISKNMIKRTGTISEAALELESLDH